MLGEDTTVAVFVQSPVNPGWSGFETRRFGKNFLTFQIKIT
ncbi:hypothetical protein LEP1GSC100_1007 [Leptospira interrogans serovar Bataviae str. UI 08561]|nr:hypothetical protein LEP1GSC100_1007 [Leptospira interrogans serovar Bataviae str. UI 08561]